MPINLSKEETFKLIAENNKINGFNEKFSFTAKYPWKCLNCQTDIFISYKQFGRIAIFCEDCDYKANNSTKEIKFVQTQYMRVVKEKQLQLIEKFLNNS